MSGVKVAFLYSEVAGYFLSCAQELSKHAQVLIFRWPVNNEAPFDLSEFENLTIIDRSKLNQESLEAKLREFDPSILICSGWMDKGYVKAAKSFKKKIPVVLTLDNHWTGSLKQRIAAAVSPFHIKKIFNKVWVPGPPQAEFAERLGFKGNDIYTDFYCANTDLFKSQFEESFAAKKEEFPKRFLYVARYAKHKGIFEMWQAFQELQEDHPNDWELWCCGTGEEWDNRVEGDKIQHFGFIQPNDMIEYVRQTGVYILPSKFEPWGVTTQEFAVSGFPLLLSNEIGAKWKFLEQGLNGFEFEAGSVEAIKRVMLKCIEMDQEELIKMAAKSHEIGMENTPEKWSQKLLSILN